MDLPPELKQGIFLLLAEKEIEMVGEVFPDIANDPYFKACYQYSYHTFFKCCGGGLVEGARMYLNKNADVNYTDLLDWRPLHFAARNGHVTIVQMLLDHPRIKVNAFSMGSWTPLHFAVYNGRHIVVKMLLDDPRVEIKLHHRCLLSMAKRRRNYRMPNYTFYSIIAKLLQKAAQKVIYKSFWYKK